MGNNLIVSKKRNLVIIGAGGFARETAWIVERINSITPTWNLVGFMEKKENINSDVIWNYPILAEEEMIDCDENMWYVCAVGTSNIRKEIINKYEGKKFATLIDPSVIMSSRITVGEGTIICAGTILTVDINIGNHVIVNLDCTIGHDAILRDYTTLYPSVNISGMVEIEQCCEIGTGANIIQGKKIGCQTIIGAGAVVIRDIPDKCTAVGSPAKPIKTNI